MIYQLQWGYRDSFYYEEFHNALRKTSVMYSTFGKVSWFYLIWASSPMLFDTEINMEFSVIFSYQTSR